MTIIIALVALTLIFFAIRKHTGPAHLAMIAGLSVYEMFGIGFAETLQGIFSAAPLALLDNIIYLALVLVFPLLLYFHSSHGGLTGILRLAEAVIFAALMVALISTPLAYFFPFDSLSVHIASFVHHIEGTIVVIGIITAYLDILFFKHHQH